MHRELSGAALWPRARASWAALADLAFPSTCLGCAQRIRSTGLNPPLCTTCQRGIPGADTDALALRFGKLPLAPPFVHLAALWTYDERGTVARVQHRLKYGNRPTLGVALGRWLADQLPPALSFDGVVPVPLHRQRLLSRGYNQSASLARGLAEARGLALALDLLLRARPTRSQTKLGHAERWTNVQGAFRLRSPRDLTGQHLLLVDDVLTTGATLAAAAEPLVAAGARVSVVALACTREYL